MRVMCRARRRLRVRRPPVVGRLS